MSRVSVVLSSGRGHSVLVLSLPVFDFRRTEGGVHTFVVASGGPMHHFCL